MLLSAAAVSACGCILTSEDGAASDEPPTAARQGTESATEKATVVAGKWQDEMRQRLEADKTALTDAWGLFSEGGWADNGQVMIFAKGGAAAGDAKLALVRPTRKAIEVERPLSSDEWSRISAAIEGAKGLKNVEETVFDGLIYQYVHFRKDAAGTVTSDAAVLMRLAQEGRAPAHDSLIKAFTSLQPKPEKKKPEKKAK